MSTNEENAVEMIENAEKEDNRRNDESVKPVPHINIFKPHDTEAIDDIEDLSDEMIEKLVHDNARAKLQPKLTRVVGTIILGFVSVGLVAWTHEDFHVTKAISISLIVMFVFYFTHIFYLIMYSKTAYRIYSLSSTVSSWTPMPITYRALQYKKDSISSISEFSAIGGGIANQMLLAIGILTTTIVVVQQVNNVWFEKIWLSFTNNLLCDTCKHKTVIVFDPQYIDIFFIFFGSFGLALLGIFELDPFSKILGILHYFGGLLGLGTIIGFVIQQYYTYKKTKDNYFGLFWASFFSFTAIISYCLWIFYFGKKAEKFSKEIKKNSDKYKTKEIDKQIRLNSIYCIVAESIFLMSGAFSLCCWLWFYNDLNPSFSSTDGGVLPEGGPWKFYFDYIIEKYHCDGSIPKNETC